MSTPSSVFSSCCLVRRHPKVCLVLAATTCLVAATWGGSASASSTKSETLTIAEWTNPPAIRTTKYIDRLFHKMYPNITVDLEQAPTENNAYTTLTDTLFSSKRIDILAEFPPEPEAWPPAFTASAKLKPSGIAALISSGQITNLIREPFLKNYDLSEQRFGIGHNGGVYGIVAAEYGNAGSLWYKKGILAKYHMRIPTTYSQLLKDCRILKKNGVTPFFVAGQTDIQASVWDGIVDQLFMETQPSSKAGAVSAEIAKRFWYGTLKWNSPIFKTAARRYEALMQYVEPAADGVGETNAPGEWAARSNNYAFFVDGTYDGPLIKAANPTLKFGSFQLPGTNDPRANRLVLVPDLTWVVPSWAPQKQAALEWLKLFSETKIYKRWLSSTGSVSTEPGVATKKLSWTTWDTAHSKTAYSSPFFGVYAPAGAPTAAFGPNLTTMVPFGKTSVAQTLNSSAAAYARIRGK